MAKHHPRGFWIAHVEGVGAGTMSKAAYCRRHGLDYKTLLRWVRRVRSGNADTKAAGALVPITVREASPIDRAALTLRVGPQVWLSLPATIDAQWLGALLREVTGC